MVAGQWFERTAIGWLVLDDTGSAFLTAAAWAIRALPGAILGPVSGAVADRVSRSWLLTVASLARVAITLATALAASADAPLGLLMALIFLSGCSAPFSSSALHPLTRDVAGGEAAMTAISLNAFGQRTVGVAAALSAGLLIGWADTASALVIAAVLAGVGASAFAMVRAPKQATARSGRFRDDVAGGLMLAVRYRLVGLLLLLAIAAENLGFAVNAVFPVMAEDVYNAGPEGLGMLGAAVGFGSVLGALGLAVLGDYRRNGLLMVATTACFGALMVAFASTPALAAGLLFAAGIGAMMAAVDTLQWIALQSAVPDEYRGRVMGAWSVAIGLGWMGPIALGALSAGIGVQPAIAVFGVALLVTGLSGARSRTLIAATPVARPA
jgi:MFS family permease